MRAWVVASAAAGAAALLALSAQTPAPDPVMRAMHDELDRARKITVANLEAPYFIEYVMDEADTYTVNASLGGLVLKRRERFRQPEVHVRVGDYKFDNTNFAGGGFGGFGASHYDLERFPLENSYPVLRRYLWLETDSAYKSAVEAISRKRAALRNVSQTGDLNDFAHADPIHSLHPFHALELDEDAWADKVRVLSAVFADYPEVKNSSVEMEASAGGYVVVNSEGTEVREPENAVFLRARATAQAADGTTLRDSITFHALDPVRLPPEAEMRRGMAEMAQHVVALAKAPKGEDYNGPVLFEGAAGAQVFAEVLGENLSLPRRPAGGGGRGGGSVEPSELDGRLGARVLPDSFSVLDDPTQKEWRGRPLFGSYDVDREGVPAKPLQVVEKGVLKTYLLTRQPVKGFEGSNGRARLPGNYGASTPTISNLFVSSSEGVPPADLKKQLIELINTRNKPYGILVRRMDFPSTASLEEARRLLSGIQGAGRPVSVPILAYKIYPDGREELVRSLRFRAFNVRSLKDILAAGNDSTVFDFMDNPAPFALVGASPYFSEACVVAPSILVDDLEMQAVEEDLPKLPVVPAPEFVR
jgi:PmbA/TldA metallopeptidase C-terminal domain